MNKKDLSMAIEEGIYNSYSKVAEDISQILLIIFFVFLIAIVGNVLINRYLNYQCSKEGNCIISTTAPPSCFPLRNLKCTTSVTNMSENPHIETIIEEIYLCGYNEAKNYYDIINKYYDKHLTYKFECHAI